MLQHKQTAKTVKKLLLLGSGSSGKSTLFKQLKCIFKPWGLEPPEFDDSLHSMRTNVVQGIIKLLQKSEDLYKEDSEKYAKCKVELTEDLVQHIQILLLFRHESFEHMDDSKWGQLTQLGESIDYLWRRVPGIQATFNQRGTRFAFHENMDYFFDKATILFGEDFQPSMDDVLRCKVITTGMVEMMAEHEDHVFHIFDVGGQRNERKKWIHCFDHVTAVLYVAALSHFDAVCHEDEKQNAMHESIQLFAEICNSKWFRRTAMILFLNKEDLFREKLRDCVNIDYCFSPHGCGWRGESYSGPCYTATDKDKYRSNVIDNKKYLEQCYQSQIDFIRKVYHNQKQDQRQKVYTHITNATDRDQIEKVFWDCQNIIIRKNVSMVTGGVTAGLH